MKRSFFDWAANSFSRKFESARVSSAAFVKKFDEVRSLLNQHDNTDEDDTYKEVENVSSSSQSTTSTLSPLPSMADLPANDHRPNDEHPLQSHIAIRLTSTPARKTANQKRKKKEKPSKTPQKSKKVKITTDENVKIEDDKEFLNRLKLENKTIDGKLSFFNGFQLIKVLRS